MNRFAKSCFLALIIAVLVVGAAPGSEDEVDFDALEAQLETFWERVYEIVTDMSHVKKAGLEELGEIGDSLEELEESVEDEQSLALQWLKAEYDSGPIVHGDDVIIRMDPYSVLSAYFNRLDEILDEISYWQDVVDAQQLVLLQREETTPDAEAEAAAMKAAKKLKVTDAEGQPVVGVTVSVNADDGTTIVTTDENGEAEFTKDPESHYQIVLSGPNLPDVVLTQKDILDMQAGTAPAVFVSFNQVVTFRQRRAFATAITEAAREQTGIPDLVARQIRLPDYEVIDGVPAVTYCFRFYRDASAAAKEAGPDVVDGAALQSSLEEKQQSDMDLPQPYQLIWDVPEFVLPSQEFNSAVDFDRGAADLEGVAEAGRKEMERITAEETGQPDTTTRFEGFTYLGQNVIGTYSTVVPITPKPDRTKSAIYKRVGPRWKFYMEEFPAVKTAELWITILETTLPNDPYYSSHGSWGQKYDDQWAMRRVGFTPVDEQDASAWPADWRRNDASLARCIVALIGTGVDYHHADLRGHLWMNLKEEPFNNKDDDGNGFVDDFRGWNFRENNDDVMDHGGHDTHTAGVIASGWNNNEGIAGVNPAALIMPLKIANFLGEADSISAAQAIAYAVDHGARVINLSYDGPRESHVFQLATDYAASKGVLVVGAAGNESEDTAGHTVSGARGVFTVAGTALGDKRVGFSNWGQAVDIAAPALDVLSLRARGTDFLLSFAGNPDYEAGVAVVGEEKVLYRAGGTSFGAPIVAGTASLLWSLEPDLTLEQVKRKPPMSADDIETPGWDQYTGAGLLNAKKAIEADPDYYLYTRISKLTAARRSGQVFVDVHGRAEGSQFTGRWLQIGRGEEPGKDDWTTVAHSKEPVEDGLLGSVPTSRFDQGGVWMVRLLVQDERQLVREARARLDLK